MPHLPCCTKQCCTIKGVLDISLLTEDNHGTTTDAVYNSDISMNTGFNETISGQPPSGDQFCTESNHDIGFYLADETFSSSSSSASSDSGFLTWEDAISAGVWDTAFIVNPSNTSLEQYEVPSPCLRDVFVSPRPSSDNSITHACDSIKQNKKCLKSRLSAKSRTKRMLSRFKLSGVKFFSRK